MRGRADSRSQVSSLKSAPATARSRVLQLRQGDFAVAVQHVVRTEGDDMTRGQDVVRAALHHTPHIKIVRIQKRRNRDPKQLFPTYLFLDHPCDELLTCSLRINFRRRTKHLQWIRSARTLRIALILRSGSATTTWTAAIIPSQIQLHQPLAFVTRET